MGCDIHIYVERKNNGKWLVVNPKEGSKLEADWRRSPSTNPMYEMAQLGLPEAEREPEHPEDWPTGRNYALFGLLAGVRGQRPCATGEPKGMPRNVSKKVGLRYRDWGLDAHTPSWLTLRELKEKIFGREETKWCRFHHLEAELEEVAVQYGIDFGEIRIVFWFDN